jgi:hypothetical protein
MLLMTVESEMGFPMQTLNHNVLIVTEQQGPVPNLVVQMHGGRLTSDNYPLSKTYTFILVLHLAVCMRGTIDTITRQVLLPIM